MISHWVNSAGGPLICATLTASMSWRGNSPLGSDEPTDYQRACGQTALLSTLPCGDGRVLVLGDEPLQSAFHRGDSGLVIVRWISAASMDAVTHALSSIPVELPKLQADETFIVGHSQLIMFDAALSWPELSASAVASSAEGRFRVTTERFSSGRHFDLIIHRFVLASSAV